jgi:hypothetical protein
MTAQTLNLYFDSTKASVRPVSKEAAKQIIIENHYSGTWTKVSYCLGLFYNESTDHKFFDGVNERLIGVICYGDPIGRHSGASISTELHRTEVLELTRLYIFDGYGTNAESWFVGQSFKWLRKNAPHIKGLISYSDPKAGHLGTVYQATNWIYQGNRIRPNDSWLFRLTEDGEWQHGRTVFPYWGTNNPEKIREKISSPIWLKKEPRKHRYIYILSDLKSERKKILKGLKYPALSYPKQVQKFEEGIIKLEPL